MPDFTAVDNATISTRRRTPEGFLIARAAVTRSGVFDYKGTDLGRPSMSNVKLFRTIDSIKHPNTLASIRAAAITMVHPQEGVDRRNWKAHTVGNTIGEPEVVEVKDGVIVETDIVVRDERAIKAIMEGRDQMSVGQTITFDDSDDDAYNFETKDALLTNHISLTRAGRAGPDIRIYDEDESEFTMDEQTRTQLIDAVREGMKNSNGNSDATVTAITDALSPVIEKVGNIQKVLDEQEQARIADEQKAKAKKVLDDAIAATKATERRRFTVLQDADAFLTDEQKTKLADADIKDILVAAIGDAVPDASSQTEDYLSGYLAHAKAAKPQSTSTQDGRQRTSSASPKVNDSSSAYDEWLSDLENAYKEGPGGQKAEED